MRPEHFDLRLFEYGNQDAASVFESTLVQAQAASGASSPTFVGIKMHDNDFFAEQSAWLSVYLDGGKRPNWDPTLQSPLLAQTEQDAMWSLYEQMVIYVASIHERVGVVNAPMILEMLP